jgi:hypothetical protein
MYDMWLSKCASQTSFHKGQLPLFCLKAGLRIRFHKIRIRVWIQHFQKVWDLDLEVQYATFQIEFNSSLILVPIIFNCFELLTR